MSFACTAGLNTPACEFYFHMFNLRSGAPAGSTGKPKGICVQHCGVANVIAHKLVELKHAGVVAGSAMLNWMALNFGKCRFKQKG